MTRLEKIELAIKKGITCNPETGEVFGVYGRKVNTKNKAGYNEIVMFDDEKKRYKLYSHQFIWYSKYNEIVDSIDHINGDKSDNRISNLRPVKHQENMFNITNAKGYYYDKLRKSYKAQIHVNYKTIYLGTFNSEDEASKAYQRAKQKYHQI